MPRKKAQGLLLPLPLLQIHGPGCTVAPPPFLPGLGLPRLHGHLAQTKNVQWRGESPQPPKRKKIGISHFPDHSFEFPQPPPNPGPGRRG